MSQNEYQLSDDNKTLDELMQEANQIFFEMNRLCNKIIKTCKRAINKLRRVQNRRSCLAPMSINTTFPFEYEKNLVYGQKGTTEFNFLHEFWTYQIRNERVADRLLLEAETLIKVKEEEV